MPQFISSRRRFIKAAGALTGSVLLPGSAPNQLHHDTQSAGDSINTPADYTLRIATTPIELAPKRIVSATTYNGQFPGPLLRFREGERVTVDVHNDTNTP